MSVSKISLRVEVLGLLGGSWVVRSGVISRATIPIAGILGLLTPLTTLNPKP